MSKCEITKKITGYAYARNGNVHNPTPKVRWDVFYKGRRVGSTHYLRQAKELAAMFEQNPEW